MALYWLDLSYVSKKQPAGTLGAHLNYTLRESACDLILSVNLSTNKHELKREIAEYEAWAEENTRKDARLSYKVMHALPINMPREAQVEATRRFIWELSGRGKARVSAQFHDMDTHNPHVHITFIDRDIKTGKSVMLLSEKESSRRKKGLEPNATVFVRKLWEIECNGVFAEYGIQDRIDHRSNLARGLAEAGEKKRGWEINKLLAERDNTIHIPPAMREAIEEHTEQRLDMSKPSEEAVADDKLDKLIAENAPPVSQVEAEAAPAEEPTAEEMEEFYSTIERVQSAVEYKRELDDLKRIQAKLEDATNAIETAGVQLEAARVSAADAISRHSLKEQSLHRAEERLGRYTRSNGNLKGFTLFGWRSPSRKAAEEAGAEVRSAGFAVDYARKDMEEAENYVGYWQTKITEQEEAKARAETEAMTITQAYGEEATLESAKQTLTYNAHRDLEGISVTKLTQMVQDGEITEGEYRDALELFGTAEAEEAIRAFDGYEPEQDEGPSL